MTDQVRVARRVSVLFVCTGNICRSPLAEQLLRSKLEGASWSPHISSAGTRARSGESMTPQAAASSILLGGNPDGHSATQLNERMVKDVDLVLTATLAQRAEVVTLWPRASRTTFTIREFSRLLDTYSDLRPEGLADMAPSGSFGGFVSEVHSVRGYGRMLPAPGDDDIPDPYRRGQEYYDNAGRLIDESVTSIARAVRGLARNTNLENNAVRLIRDNGADGPSPFRSRATGER